MMPQQSLLQTLLLGCLALGAGILLAAPQSATAAPTQQKPPKVDALVIPINPAVFEIGQLRRGLLDAFAKESGALQNSNLDDGQSQTKATATSSTKEDDDDAEDEDEDVYEEDDNNDDGDEAPAGHQQKGEKSAGSAVKKPKASLQGIVSFDCVHADRIAKDLEIIISTLKKQDTLRAESAARRTSKFKAKAREDIITVAKGHLQEEADKMRRSNEEIMKDLEAERHRQPSWKTSFLETSEEVSKKKNVVEKNVTKRLAGSLELLAKTVEHCLPQDRKSAAHGLGQLGQLGQVDPQLGFLQRLPGKLRGVAASLAAWEHQMDFKEREEYDHLQSSFDKDLKQEAEKELSPVREELRDLRARHKQLLGQGDDRLRALEAFSKAGDLFGESPKTPEKKKTKKLISSNSSKKTNEGLSSSASVPHGLLAAAEGLLSPLMSNVSNSSSNDTSSSKPENFTLDWETAIALNLHSSGAAGEGPLKNDISSGSRSSGTRTSGSGSKKVMKANDDSQPDATWYLAEARKLRMGAEVAKQADREKKAVTLDRIPKKSDVTKKHHAFHWQSNPEIQAYLRGRSEKRSASLIAIRPEREEVILEREKVLLKREDALLAKETHV